MCYIINAPFFTAIVVNYERHYFLYLMQLYNHTRRVRKETQKCIGWNYVSNSNIFSFPYRENKLIKCHDDDKKFCVCSSRFSLKNIYYVCFYILQNVPINIVILIVMKSLHFLVFNFKCYKLAWHVVDKKTRKTSISSSFGRLKCVNKALDDEKFYNFFFLCSYDWIRKKF